MIQNKHIIRLLFIGLFFNIIVNIVLYRYSFIEKVLLKHIIAQHLYASEKYNSRVLLSISQKKLLFKSIQDPALIHLLKKKLGCVNLIKSDVIVYDNSGTKLLSSDTSDIFSVDEYNSIQYYQKLSTYLDKYFLQQYIIQQPLVESLMGSTSHKLVSRAIMTDIYGRIYDKSYISSYIPLIDSMILNSSNIIGVMQITTDITEQWDKIIYLEKMTLLALVIVFLVIFIMIMYNTHYVQRIINTQFKTNRELEEAKTRAETESSAKTDFLANISHELRTPLNAIIGFSEIMIAETYGKISNSQYKNYVSDINISGKHLLSVINDILDFSKASADKLQVGQVELDLNKLASSSMRFVKPRADEAKIYLIEKMPSSHIIIIADPKRLKQALLNLLSNSVKFTPPEGSVTLTLRKDTNQKLVHIIVTDTGIGMSDKEIPQALSSFGQVDNKLSRRYEGTGLGLPLTKKLIELMKGKFDLQSKPGKGTIVTITFQYSDNIEL